MGSMGSSNPDLVQGGFRAWPHPVFRPSPIRRWARDPTGVMWSLWRLMLSCCSAQRGSTEEFWAFARSATPGFGLHAIDDQAWAWFCRADHLRAAGSGTGRPDGRGQGGRELARCVVPPAALLVGAAQGRPSGDHHAAGAELVEDSRVVMEKPFGNDLASAIKLNDFVHEVFDESQIFRVFRSMLPVYPSDVVRGQYVGYRDERASRTIPTPRRSSRSRSVWTTGGGPACRSTCAPANGWRKGYGSSRSRSRSRPRTMFPAGSGVGSQGPDHLAFDLAGASRVSLSFYGKRPGPGMRLEKLSMSSPRRRPRAPAMCWRRTSD
jgi:hypothetical protein